MLIIPIVYICLAILDMIGIYLDWRMSDERIRKKTKNIVIIVNVLGILAIVLSIIWLITLYE